MKPKKPAAELVVRVPRADPLALSGAAYLLLGEAHCVVEKDAVRILGGGKALERRFRALYEDQKRDWDRARAGLDLRAEALRRALEAAAAAPDGAPPAAPLSAERRAEIARLLDEAAGEPWDPRGVARPWRPA